MPRSVSVTLRRPNATHAIWKRVVGERQPLGVGLDEADAVGGLRCAALCAAGTSISWQKSAPTIGTVPPAARS